MANARNPLGGGVVTVQTKNKGVFTAGEEKMSRSTSGRVMKRTLYTLGVVVIGTKKKKKRKSNDGPSRQAPANKKEP